MPYTVLLAVQPQNRENLSTFHVSTLRAGGVFFFQVVVVLPLFQMLQYPEMDDSMGPKLRRQLLVGEESMVGSSVPKWGEHANDELYIYIYVYMIYIYIYHIYTYIYMIYILMDI